MIDQLRLRLMVVALITAFLALQTLAGAGNP